RRRHAWTPNLTADRLGWRAAGSDSQGPVCPSAGELLRAGHSWRPDPGRLLAVCLADRRHAKGRIHALQIRLHGELLPVRLERGRPVSLARSVDQHPRLENQESFPGSGYEVSPMAKKSNCITPEMVLRGDLFSRDVYDGASRGQAVVR